MSKLTFYKMKESFGSLSKDDLDDLIKRLKITLPEDYKSFLMNTNGGRPANQFFQNKNFGVSLVTNYYGLNFGEHDYRDLEEATGNLRRIDDVFNDVISVASDPGGLAICMGITKSNLGVIYFFDHDAPETEISLLKIADSFDDFFNSCYETPEEAEAVYESKQKS